MTLAQEANVVSDGAKFTRVLPSVNLEYALADTVKLRGGYNITPLEIENVLHQHPAVQSAAVLGLPHDVLGEDIAAAIALRPGASVDAEGLQQYVRDNLADNKVPRTIRFFDELPLNPNGKVPAIGERIKRS